MTGIFKPCMAILPPAQQQLWHQLRATVALGFVLYGGTAIALRLGHRPSIDFDFFTEKPLNRDALSALPFMANATVLQDGRNAITVLVQQSDTDDSQPSFVKVSFFGMIDGGRVGEPEMTEDGVLQVASLDDLMATKVKVVLQWAEAKDYRDIAELINGGVSLAKGLAAAHEIFGPQFQPSESLKALVYFDDGDLQTLTKDEKSTLIKAVSAIRDLPMIEIRSKQLAVVA
jgi:hypothetical protein